MPSTEAKQQTTKRMRGDGSIYRRGATFWICVYVDGRQQRESAKTGDEATALKYLRNRLKEVHAHELDASKPFLTQRARRRTVSDLMQALKADLEIRSRWNPQARTTSDHVTRAFGSMRATSLRAEDVDDYVKQRLAEGYAKATINHSLQLLRQAYKLAELPAPKIRRLDDSDNKRRGFFIELEVRRVMANLTAELADFTLFAWLTGMRKGEIASLRWEDVVGNELRLRSESSKNGEARVIPFEGELAALMERRKAARQFKLNGIPTFSALIFHRQGDPILEFRKSWRSACRLAGLRRLFHDLRRSAARNMLNAGVPQAIAMQITGHKTDSMFRRYAIVAPNDVRTALRMTQEHTAHEMAQATATVN
jgi:integrase